MRMLLAFTASMFMVAAACAYAQEQPDVARIDQALESNRSLLSGLAAPSADEFVKGDREIGAGSSVEGPIAVIGTVRVAGTVTGDVYSFDGDIVLLPGSRVTGSAVALGGRVIREGGNIEGDWRSTPQLTEAPPPPSVSETTGQHVMLTLGWAGVVLIIGIGIMVFGGGTLEVVGETVDQQFGRSLLVGVGATLAIVPALAILCIGLTLTILGVLLIPFAIVAYVLAVIGLVTLGLLAAMTVTGKSLNRSRTALSERGASLRALVTGVVLFLGLWLVAALLTPWPAAQAVMRVIAFAVTWAAATVGLGATIISRAGARPVRAASLDIPVAAEPVAAQFGTPAEPEWLTPTPVSGVAAARRRTPPPQRT